MPPRRLRKTFLILLYCLLFAGAAYVIPQVLEISRFPADLRLAPGEELHLTLKQPFSFYLPAKRPDGVIGFNGTEMLAEGSGGYCSAVRVRPQQEGVSSLEFRFFGIPIRRVNLEFVEMPRVVPGGHAVGVLMAEKGVIVV